MGLFSFIRRVLWWVLLLRYFTLFFAIRLCSITYAYPIIHHLPSSTELCLWISLSGLIFAALLAYIPGIFYKNLSLISNSLLLCWSVFLSVILSSIISNTLLHSFSLNFIHHFSSLIFSVLLFHIKYLSQDWELSKWCERLFFWRFLIHLNQN